MTDQLFSIANTAALLSWIALIFLPRHPALLAGVRWGVIGALCALYAVLISVWFFRAEGGGYFSLAAVQALFVVPEVALAGWVHYLAFDLFVGLWIATKCDGLGIARLVQAPILLATFMFGPVGLMFFFALRATLRFPRSPEVAA